MTGSERRVSQLVAPGPATFALHTLGWRAFQDLAAVVLRDIMGQSFQGFADGNDAGRDGAFYGKWHASRAAVAPYQDIIPQGPFVLQCKHTSTADATLTLSIVADELAKVQRLVQQGKCRSYILFTNARLTGRSEDRIRDALRAIGVEYPLVLGGSWICQTIASQRNLRMFVPRVYGLGDLSQILDDRAYAQAEALLRYLEAELSTFVVTDAYRRAVEALQRHGFVLLLGEPGAGKSVIAATLAMTALDAWGCATIRAYSAEELLTHWNPHEPGQFYWVDDAFGAVRHDWALTQSWALRLPSVMTAVKSGARVVMTSRDYIYRDARRSLKEYAYPLLRESQVVVDIAGLTRDERERILYNHVRLGDQSPSFKRDLKPHLDAAADAQPFRPEAARRLGRSGFTQSLKMDRKAVVDFIEKPSGYLSEVFGQLGSNQQAALALVYVAGRLSPPLGRSEQQANLLDRLGSSVLGAGDALVALDGTFVRYGSEPGGEDAPAYSFHHPTLREGFAAFIASRPALLDLLLTGLSDQAVLSQIDCGADEGSGTLVSIPPPLYPLVAARLAAMDGPLSAEWSRRFAWHQFFVQRCSIGFLTEYLARDQEFVPRLLDFGSYLGTVPQPRVLARLHQAGLLPEADRLTAIARAAELAIETPDSDWLDAPQWKALATDEDRRDILGRVRRELLPELTDQISAWRDNRPSFMDPHDYYYPLEEALGRYATALSFDQAAAADLQAAIEEVRSLAANADDGTEPVRVPGWRAPRRLDESTRPDRSIFDDVDA